MAHYLIVRTKEEVPFVLEVEGKNIHAVIGELDLDDGEAVKVYRTAGPARTVRITRETVRKITFS